MRNPHIEPSVSYFGVRRAAERAAAQVAVRRAQSNQALLGAETLKGVKSMVQALFAGFATIVFGAFMALLLVRTVQIVLSLLWYERHVPDVKERAPRYSWLRQLVVDRVPPFWNALWRRCLRRPEYQLAMPGHGYSWEYSRCFGNLEAARQRAQEIYFGIGPQQVLRDRAVRRPVLIDAVYRSWSGSASREHGAKRRVVAQIGTSEEVTIYRAAILRDLLGVAADAIRVAHARNIVKRFHEGPFTEPARPPEPETDDAPPLSE
jgi:hypothetical protein